MADLSQSVSMLKETIALVRYYVSEIEKETKLVAKPGYLDWLSNLRFKFEFYDTVNLN